MLRAAVEASTVKILNSKTEMDVIIIIINNHILIEY